MITIPDLQTALLDLLYQVQGTEIKLIVGGGFGIYLKVEHVRRLGTRTLFREWPVPRSTNDLDLFLRTELLIQSAKLKPLGMIRMRESPYCRPELQLDEFISTLRELFPERAETAPETES